MSREGTEAMMQVRTRGGLVCFLQKAIPSACLNEERENADPAMEVCMACDQEDSKVKFFKRGRCKLAQYCLKACQKAEWKRQKPYCNQLV
jgi:hypothetical protein